jgi:hypothetical protein
MLLHNTRLFNLLNAAIHGIVLVELIDVHKIGVLAISQIVKGMNKILIDLVFSAIQESLLLLVLLNEMEAKEQESENGTDVASHVNSETGEVSRSVLGLHDLRTYHLGKIPKVSFIF